MDKYNPYQNCMHLGMQFFATDGDGETGKEGVIPEGAGEKEKGFDDLLKENKDYQSEFDKKIGKALETAKIKWETSYESKLETAKTEAATLATMTAEQKAKYETAQAETVLKEREANITKRELQAEAKATLSEKGLPVVLADILNYAGAEQCNKSIESVEKAFRSSVEKAVEDRLKGGTPPKKAPENQNTLSDQIYKSMKGV